MLPTPRSQDAKHSNATAFELSKDPEKDLLHTRLNRMLPTPQARDHKNSNTTKEITPRMRRKLEQGWTIDLNDRIAITPAVEDATGDVINYAVPIALQGKANSTMDIVLNNIVCSSNWKSRLVCLQWTMKPLYSILRKNGSGKDGKRQFSLLYQLTPSPINDSQSELLPTPNTMEGLEPKSKESILAYNAKHRQGRSYATCNLRERLAYGKMEKEIAMLPTPNTTDGQNHMDTSPRHTPSLQTILADKLLPTPRSEEHYQGKGAAQAFVDAGFKYPTSRNGKERGKGKTHDTNLSTVVDAVNLLPTPTTADGGKISSQPNYGQKCLANHPAFVGYPDRPKMTKSRKGEKMLPTPTTDNGHERSPEYWENREGKHQIDLQGKITQERTGLKLQPEFTLWMMGFPTDYLDLP